MPEPLTLAEYNALIEQCGCCPAPRCCPPLLECRQGRADLVSIGWVNPGDSDDLSAGDPANSTWKQTKYLQKTFRTTWTPLPDDMSDLYWTGSAWVSRPEDPYPALSGSGSLQWDHARENWGTPEMPFRGMIGGSDCEVVNPPILSQCYVAGSLTLVSRGGWYNPGNDSWTNGVSHREVYAYSDISGTETKAHQQWVVDAAAWDALWPGGMTDWQDAKDLHDAWLAANELYQNWISDRAAWVAEDPENRAPEDYPVPAPPDPGPEPDDPGDPRPVEPDKFHPPCTCGTTVTISRYELVYDDAVVASMELVASTPELPNPEVVEYEYITIPTNFQFENATVYEQPVTWQQFVAAAEAWINARMTFSPAGSDSSCPPLEGCRARKVIGPDVSSPWQAGLVHFFFQYRFKLNKCCGYKRILSGWREVYFPQEYIEWFNSLSTLDSGDPVPPPPVDLDAISPRKEWLWEGTPPLCPENEDSAASNDTDPYDHEPMWSPWSLVVSIPDGEFGIKVLRNYQQICYGNLPDLMPQVTGAIDLSDDEPDPWQ